VAGELLKFLIGLALLTGGAELLNRGSTGLALALGIKPLLVGLTVVAFGTSCPELIVCLVGAFNPEAGTDLVLGNIVGSNIANIGLILGVCALIRPIKVELSTIRNEVPFALAAAVLLPLLGWLGGGISRVDGLLLLAILIAFFVYCYRAAMRAHKGADERLAAELGEVGKHATVVEFLMLLGGLLGLVAGAYLMVTASVTIATEFGIPTYVIAVSMVAIGTTLPELAASLVASVHGNSQLSVGNVVGSNIFNILLIIALVALITPISVSRAMFTFQFPALLVFSAAMFVLMVTGMVLKRWEGALLLVAYAVFIALTFARGMA